MLICWCHLQLGDILRKVLCKFEINPICGSGDIFIFVFPFCFSDTENHKQCLCPLHQHQCLLHLLLSCVKPVSTCHSPCMTGMWPTRCASSDCSRASLILGSSFARSRLRNAWTTYSASWARKVTQLWTAGFHLMNPTNEIQRNSLIILRAPWTMRSPPESECISLKMSRRGLMNQSMNS